PFTAKVYAEGRLMGEGSSNGGDITVEATPWIGFYDVKIDFGSFTYHERIVAPVWDRMTLNGERFLIKGTNVHGMNPHSPVKTGAMMDIMQGLGFNMWRGDYPAPWQVDMAAENRTGYMVLAPFSVSHTAEIYGRQ